MGPNAIEAPAHVYEVRPRKDKRGVDLISDVLSFGRLWYGDTNAVANAIGYAEHFSRSHHAVIHVYDDAGNVIEMHEAARDLTQTGAGRVGRATFSPGRFHDCSP